MHQLTQCREGTVGYLVTAITLWDLAEMPPPPIPQRTCISDGSTLGSRVQFHAYIPPIHHPHIDTLGRDFSHKDFYPKRKTTCRYGNPLVSECNLWCNLQILSIVCYLNMSFHFLQSSIVPIFCSGSVFETSYFLLVTVGLRCTWIGNIFFDSYWIWTDFH